jgi:hypothetical protein
VVRICAKVGATLRRGIKDLMQVHTALLVAGNESRDELEFVAAKPRPSQICFTKVTFSDGFPLLRPGLRLRL